MTDRQYAELLDGIVGLHSAMELSVSETQRQFVGVDQQFAGVDQQFAGLRRQFGELHRRFDEIDERWDRRFQTLETRVELGFQETTREFADIRARLESVELH
jgi:hypothetical protein